MQTFKNYDFLLFISQMPRFKHFIFFNFQLSIFLFLLLIILFFCILGFLDFCIFPSRYTKTFLGQTATLSFFNYLVMVSSSQMMSPCVVQALTTQLEMQAPWSHVSTAPSSRGVISRLGAAKATLLSRRVITASGNSMISLFTPSMVTWDRQTLLYRIFNQLLEL